MKCPMIIKKAIFSTYIPIQEDGILYRLKINRKSTKILDDESLGYKERKKILIERGYMKPHKGSISIR